VPHVRTQIRDAVIARLRTVNALACVGPYGRTARPFQRNDVPAAIVRASETISPITKNRPRAMRRDLSITVTLLAALNADDVDTVLDDLSVDVEIALADPTSFGVGHLVEWRLTSSELGSAAMGEDVYGSLTLTYVASITTVEGVPNSNVFQGAC
jgi:hypothetical protein